MEIKQYEIAEDILTLSATADRFPEGVKGAYEKLQQNIPGFGGRQCFGVAEPLPGGGLSYKACIEQLPHEELVTGNLVQYNIPKGKYLYLTLRDWNEHMDLFSEYFNRLLSHPDTRPDTIGLEYYKGASEVLLMVQHK
jgi:hypothetical protein